MAAIGLILSLIGYAAVFAFSVWLLIIAFQEDVVQGLLSLFVPFYLFYYVITRWETCQKPFFFMLGGLGAVALGLVIASIAVGGAG